MCTSLTEATTNLKPVEDFNLEENKEHTENWF